MDQRLNLGLADITYSRFVTNAERKRDSADVSNSVSGHHIPCKRICSYPCFASPGIKDGYKISKFLSCLSQSKTQVRVDWKCAQLQHYRHNIPFVHFKIF